MAENKQYVSQSHEFGQIMISEDVVATIAMQALSEVEGFAGLTTKSGSEFADLLKINWGKRLKIVITDDNKIRVSCDVMVYYGYSIMDVAKEIQKHITSEIKSVTAIKSVAVNVNVCGIVRK